MKAVHVAVLATLMTTCFLATSVDALKCHVCIPDLDDEDSCKATDFGVEEDGCTNCYVEEMNDHKQVKRSCETDDGSDMGCEMDKGLQFCHCNNADLCNKVLKPVMKCHVCDYTKNAFSCYTDRLGELKDGCLSCYSVKLSEKRWGRDCLVVDVVASGCNFDEGVHECYCHTDKCNAKDIILPTMKCYVCKPKSARDTSCNFANSGSVQDGCLTCDRSFDRRNITTRSCIKDYARADFTEMRGGITSNECGKDLCNGEGEEKVDDDKASRGLQKTVSSRVLISGITTAMLGLAQFF